MADPFEDPRKTDMRGRCEIAIDGAGHELVTALVTVPLSGDLKGAIKGDLQSLDGHEVRHVYYLRPEGNKPIPQWLVNLAKSARDNSDIRLFVVVTAVSAVLEKSCKAGGVGLLRLTEDNSFELIVDPSEITPEEVAAQVTTRIRDARRRMERKLELNRAKLEQNYGQVDELTAGMPATTRDSYIEAVEQAATRWEEWGARISSMLDEAGPIANESLVDAAERLIEEGAEE